MIVHPMQYFRIFIVYYKMPSYVLCEFDYSSMGYYPFIQELIKGPYVFICSAMVKSRMYALLQIPDECTEPMKLHADKITPCPNPNVVISTLSKKIEFIHNTSGCEALNAQIINIIENDLTL